MASSSFLPASGAGTFRVIGPGSARLHQPGTAAFVIRNMPANA
jgi:hypothetical protein